MLADQVDRGDQSLGLDRQQPRRPRERVAIRLGVDLDRAVREDLRVEHIGTGAEVDDVQDGDVLLQFLVGKLEPLAHLGREQRPARPAGVDQDARERRQPREPLRPDRRVSAEAVGLVSGIVVLCARWR